MSAAYEGPSLDSLHRRGLRRIPGLVPLVTSFILVSSGGLKLHELMTSPESSTATVPRWAQLLSSEFELALGIWLVIGFQRRVARLVALVGFSIFVVVNLYQIQNGSESCGCFGRIEIDPWYALSLDIVLVALLCAWRAGPGPMQIPSSRDSEPSSPARATPSRVIAIATLAFGLLVLVGALAIRALIQQGELARSITVDHNEFNFGELEQAQSVRHSFILSNRGRASVTITQVRTTCSCSTADDIVGQVIEPGGTLPLEVVLRTGDGDGERSSRITVYFQDPKRRASAFLWLDVRGNVVTDYWVRPLVLNFGVVDHAHPITRIVKLRPNKLHNVQITGLETNDPCITARLISPSSENGDLEVETTFSGAFLPHSGPVSSPLRIHTTSPRTPITSVLIQADYRAAVETEPASVIVPSGPTAQRKHEVRLRSARVARIVSCQCSPSELKYEIIRGVPSSESDRLVLTLPDDDGSGLNGQLRIEVESMSDRGVKEVHFLVVPVIRLRAPKKEN